MRNLEELEEPYYVDVGTKAASESGGYPGEARVSEDADSVKELLKKRYSDS
jgi:hypothetical protein